MERAEGAGSAGWRAVTEALSSLHSVALEYRLARRAQPCAVLLQTLLHHTVIAEILAAEPRSVAGTGLLLLGSALMSLRERRRRAGYHEEKHEKCTHIEGPWQL